MSSVVVLDTWPFIRLFEKVEPAAVHMKWLLSGQVDVVPVMSVVNYSELTDAMAREHGLDAARAITGLAKKYVTIESPSFEAAETAGLLKYAYRMWKADSFAAATALVHDAPLWSGDLELICDDRLWLVQDLRTVQDRERHAELLASGRARIGVRPAVAAEMGRDRLRKMIMSGVGVDREGTEQDFGLGM